MVLREYRENRSERISGNERLSTRSRDLQAHMRNTCNIVLVGFHDFAGERSERSPRVQPPEFIETLRNVPCLLENFQIADQIFDDVFLVLLENH